MNFISKIIKLIKDFLNPVTDYIVACDILEASQEIDCGTSLKITEGNIQCSSPIKVNNASFQNGTMTGDVIGNVTGNIQGDILGDIIGDVTGNVLGNVTGDVYGDVTGNVYGDLTGDVLGNLTGNLSGTVVLSALTSTPQIATPTGDLLITTDQPGNSINLNSKTDTTAANSTPLLGMRSYYSRGTDGYLAGITGFKAKTSIEPGVSITSGSVVCNASEVALRGTTGNVVGGNAVVYSGLLNLNSNTSSYRVLDGYATCFESNVLGNIPTSGTISAMRVNNPSNGGQFTALLDIQSAATGVATTTGVVNSASQAGAIKVMIAGVPHYIPLYSTIT